MTDLQLLLDLHQRGPRQGPGGDAQTHRAVELAGLGPSPPLESRALKVADLGCGSGAPTLQLARSLNARITAVDLFPEFLQTLEERAEAVGLADRIETVQASMEDLPLDEGEWDVLWSEGAIYNVGFEAGVRDWRRFLKPGGILAVSEATWFTAERPAEIQEYWHAHYPEIDLASAKIAALEASGYSPLGYFVLPERCWLENYYRPLEDRFEGFLQRHGHTEEARAVVAQQREEIAMYERYKACYGYGFYVSRWLG